MKRRIELGGREFEVVEEFTLEQEVYLAGLIRRGRLDRLPLEPSDSCERAVTLLLQTLEQSHVSRAVLSALIVPVGEIWTLAEAQQTASHIKEWIGTVDDNASGMIAVVLGQALFDRGILRASLDGRREGPANADTPRRNR